MLRIAAKPFTSALMRLSTLAQASAAASVHAPSSNSSSPDTLSVRTSSAASSSATSSSRSSPHKLHEFFEDNMALPKFNSEKRIPFGRAWRVAELEVKSFDDLHCLWYVLLKERNLLATQEAEASRENVPWHGGHRDHKCRLSMARIKTVLTARQRAYDLAKLAEERLSRPDALDEGELWVQWDEEAKQRIYRAKPWYRQKQRFLRRIHPMF